MITLYAFGPNFGVPDPSPFAMKAMILLKMAGQPYTFKFCDPRRAPKRKGPFIVDDGVTVPDTTFIRWHLEKKYGVDFDAGLDASQRATAWAFEKLCEDNLYWAALSERWMIDSNFYAGPKIFFDAVPAPLRGLVIRKVRADQRRNLYGQGLGRHTRAELMQIAEAGIAALDAHLGDKPYMMGAAPTSLDAVAFPTVAACTVKTFETPLADMVAQRPRLAAYTQRCMTRWFPDFE